MSSAPEEVRVLVVRDLFQILKRFREDPGFTWEERWEVDRAIGDVCCNWQSYREPNTPRMQKRILALDAVGIAITFQLAFPEDYGGAHRAGFIPRAISRF